MHRSSVPQRDVPSRLKRNAKSFGTALVGAAALFGVLSAFVLMLAPEKIPTITDSLSALGQKGYRLPDTPVSPPGPESDLRTLKTFSKVFVNIAKQTRPALVFIKTERTAQVTRRAFPFDEFFFPFGIPEGGQRGGRNIQEGAGSGFLVDLKAGYVITNNHVVQNADTIRVETFDGRKFKAKLIGTEPSVDVAVIKLENFSPGPLKQVSFGDSDNVEVGDWVVALGAPFGLPQTLTVGVVSALGRGQVLGNNALEDFIQTDAAINPGNSGGPLVNLEGRVVGINTAISSPTGSFAGIGFAVPANMARLAAEMLINEGKVTRGYLGVAGRDFSELSSDVLSQLNVHEDSEGALVASVEPDTPAAKAGLKPYDIIKTLNGNAVKSFSELRNKIAFTRPGTDVRLGIVRDGKSQELKARVEARPGDQRIARTSRQEESSQSGKAALEFGLQLNNLSGELRRQLNIGSKNGVIVVGVGEESEAAFAGLRRGDVIVEINRKTMKSVKDVESELGKARSRGGDLLFLIERNGQPQLLVLRQR